MQKLLEQGIALHQQGRLDEAWAIYEQILMSAPASPEALHLSGVVCNVRRQHQEAARRIGRAIELDAEQPLYYVNFGNALSETGQAGDAEKAFRRAIALMPSLASAHFNLGNLLSSLGREDEAIAAYDQTVVQEPRHFKALLALARILYRRRQPEICLALLKRALAVNPAHEEALRITAATLNQLRFLDDALATLDRLLDVVPRDPGALAYKGIVLAKMRRFEEAIEAHRAALAIEPGNAVAIEGLADALARCGRPAEAVAALQAGLVHQAGNPDLFSQYLFLLNFIPAVSPQEFLAEHKKWETRFCSAPALAPLPFFANAPVADRRLKIGYVSADFRQHSVSFFIEPVLTQYDRSNFEIFCYSSTEHADAVTHRLRGKTNAWRDVSAIDDEELAAQVRRDGIDILVDLSGHSGGHRLLCFARKPAPIQVSYLGYPNTTGLSTIDYRISDRIADPIGHVAEENSEKILHLPDCFHCYRAVSSEEIDPTPPAVRNGWITFGSFNVIAKLSDDTLAAWAAILLRVPNSRLHIKSWGASDGPKDYLHQRFSALGIAPERLLASPFDVDHAEHMQRYRGIDIALDSFPYNGTTTTCDAMWMGVPVVTLRGKRHAARVGASLLHAVGLDELIAEDADGYVDLAVALAEDTVRLKDLHASLRDRMRASPLMDEARFVRNLEQLYRHAWTNWCKDTGGGLAAPR
jgi:protein O-GlcNAc transferase